jgi:hypothetical protein
MALFTDGTMVSVEELAAHDSSVLEVASAEGIDLTRKLELAQMEVGIELTAALGRLSPAEHWAAGGGADELTRVVATPALRMWHAFRALELAYRDAFHNQLNDRYRERRDEYHDLARWAAEKLLQIGVGMAADPTPRAVQPSIRPMQGALPAGMYFVTMCWVNRSGEEGASAGMQGVTTAAGGGFAVATQSAPTGAAGWNVYVGTSPEGMRRQNSRLLESGEEWKQTAAPASGGARPGEGQEPTYLRPVPRLIQRG